MSKRAEQPEEELEDDNEYEEYEEGAWKRSPLWLRISSSLIVLAVLLTASFELVYAGKVYPGVTANGASLSGLSKVAAAARINDKTTEFDGHVITISDGDTNLRIPVAQLQVAYDGQRAADLAFRFGREGSFFQRAHEQLRALLGRVSNFSVYSYDDAHLVPYIVDLDDEIVSPVQNATLSFDNSHAQVTPSQSGSRLDLGRLTQLINDRLSQTSIDTIPAPVYKVVPSLDTAPLQAAASKLDSYLSGPITLSYSGVDREVDQKTIISWIQVGSVASKPFLASLKLDDLYPPPPSANLGLDKNAVQKYVVDLAGSIDQTAQNAGLVMQNNQLTIAQPSRNGVKLNQADAVDSLIASLKKTGDDRRVALKLDTTVADVNENNLSQLGIKELISEGVTLFPGSPSTRLTNVRAGAKKFNGVLLKPGQTFSFGALLGAVGPETGYVPELVILGDHEEKQYGGGLCQVSSTAYRAALLAGLPILERVNHSFAISYYTAPYGVPGVDATIFYPQVDFKFKNDTGSYILIQTIMDGTTLKFDYFGTKTKSGVIRGPEFVSGSSDATQPSHTVFYRDVLDLAGNVTKTDTVNTYYKSSKDFPVTKQFN